MKRYIYKYALLLSAVALWSCEPNTDDFNPSKGSADFTNFVAIGDSYTAGYTDGALGRRGQEESFSAILGKQLMYVGGTSYNQPFVQSESSVGSMELQPGVYNGYYELNIVEGSLKPQPTIGDVAILGEQVSSPDNQNFGVPGAKLIHLGELPAPYPPYAQLNPFYARFASSPDATVLGDALAAEPSFVSFWVGNNDILAYAMAGGEADAITDPAMFAAAYTQAVNAILSTGSKAVLGNVPAIETIPFFNHILKDGHLPLVIVDDAVPGGIRQLVEGEKILLSASTALGMGYGQSVEMPLGAEYVLDLNELNAISSATTAYNATIKSIADENGIAHVDLAKIMEQLSTSGLIIDGNRYTTTFVSGGVFSLDGIHATGRGSAIIANAFIDAINAKYDAQVPHANINDYNMVEFP
ncbi:SGNH/GDSL hydrolase family protein [Carboxylicivirga sp. M1479]|uniref:SGNH/GDSL hydrolase family protein n=1 Tax=Carboxylicivirga sp. M1479 TaxID=2594476 RepID=UPI00163D86F3|nr:SGNH/GDSL hydrolase family protein [Carboxylicivirga sp. M1479]